MRHISSDVLGMGPGSNEGQSRKYETERSRIGHSGKSRSEPDQSGLMADPADDDYQPKQNEAESDEVKPPAKTVLILGVVLSHCLCSHRNYRVVDHGRRGVYGQFNETLQ